MVVLEVVAVVTVVVVVMVVEVVTVVVVLEVVPVVTVVAVITAQAEIPHGLSRGSDVKKHMELPATASQRMASAETRQPPEDLPALKTASECL